MAKETTLDNPVIPAAVAEAIKTTVVADPPAAAPVVAKVDAPVTPAVVEIDEVKTTSDAIAVALGEKKVKVKAAAPDPAVVVVDPAVPAVKPEDAPLEAEIATVAAKMGKTEREAFARKTYELRDANRKLKEAEAAVEAAKLAAATPAAPVEDAAAKAELERLRAATADYEKQLSAVRLESTQTFKDRITTPRNNAVELFKAAAKAHEIPDADVVHALSLPAGKERDDKLNEMLGGMNELNKTRAVQALFKIDTLAADAAALQADAQSSLARLESDEKAAKEAQTAAEIAERKAAEPAAWNSLVTQVPGLAPIEGDANWNSALDNAAKFGQRDYADFTPTAQVSIMQRAGAFPLIAGLVQHQAKEIARLTAELKAVDSATPGAGEGGNVTQPVATDKTMSFSEAVSAKLKGLGVN